MNEASTSVLLLIRLRKLIPAFSTTATEIKTYYSIASSTPLRVTPHQLCTTHYVAAKIPRERMKMHFSIQWRYFDVQFSLIMAEFDESNPTLFTSMAHRISESKQGRGVFRQFEAACHRLLLSHFPQLTHWLVVAFEKYRKPGGYTPLYRMVCRVFNDCFSRSEYQFDCNVEKNNV
jgi:hypothetical protein